MKEEKQKKIVGIVSPPYSDTEKRDRSEEKWWNEEREKKFAGGSVKIERGYQSSPQNIGNLPDKALVGIVSPPYVDSITKTRGKQGRGKYSELDLSKGMNRLKDDYMKYGDNPQNIGNLKDKQLVGIISPPYSHESTPMKKNKWQEDNKWKSGHQNEMEYAEENYRFKHNKSKGNIGKMKLFRRVPCSPNDLEAKHDNRLERKGTKWEWTKEIEVTINDLIERRLVGITSPPYGLGEGIGHAVKTPSKLMMDMWGGAEFQRYGDMEGNIGNLHNTETKAEESFPIEHFHQCNTPLYWHGCYGSEGRFKKFITQESFAHPAKMSLLLADKIFKHLKELGLLNKGDVVCDFMSGSGRTGIMASLHGHDSVHVELEPHFIKMIEDNKKLLEKKTQKKQNWTVIQGDARHMSELLKEKGYVGITSPPYSEAQDGGGIANALRGRGDYKIQRVSYGKKGEILITPMSAGKSQGYRKDLHKTEGNISNLPDKALVGITTPPYEAQSGGTNPAKQGTLSDRRLYDRHRATNISEKGYGVEEGNLGNQQGDSYLSAMLSVYREAYKSGISPLVIVTKNPTRKKKLRD